jgi:hypothetical protein
MRNNNDEGCCHKALCLQGVKLMIGQPNAVLESCVHFLEILWFHCCLHDFVSTFLFDFATDITRKVVKTLQIPVLCSNIQIC